MYRFKFMQSYPQIPLFVTLWILIALYTAPAGGVTPNRYLDLTHAIVNEGRFEIDTYHSNTVDKSYRNGHYYAGCLPGPALTAVPFYIIFKPVYALVPEKIKSSLTTIQSYKKNRLKASVFYGTVDNVEYFVSQAFASAMIMAGAGALSAVIIFLLVIRFGFSRREALFSAFLYATGTITFFHGTVFFEQNIHCLFVLLSAFFIFSNSKSSVLKVFVGGVFAGCCIWVEASGVLVCCVFSGYILWKFGKRKAAFFAAGVILINLPQMYLNFRLFGSPLKNAYFFLISDHDSIVKEGFTGVSYPRLERLLGLLISPERGILVFSPIFILAFLGIIDSIRNRRQFHEAIAVLVLFCSGWLFVGSFKGWNAGGGFGARYVMFAVSSLLVFFPSGMRLVPFPMTFFLSAISILINWAGAQYGFADNYYQNLEKFIQYGYTTQIFLAIETHSVQGGSLQNFFTSHQFWLKGLWFCATFFLAWSCFRIVPPREVSLMQETRPEKTLKKSNE